MNEDFVPFELAKKLKEKGFRELCFTRYYCSDKVYFERNSYDPDTNNDLYCYNNDEDLGRFYIDAPTISQVLKWLFDEKQLFINVDCNICDHFGLYFKVYKKSEETWEECATGDDYFYHPTKAISAGIKYVIDNLI